jgi:LmbE family N-acetylglucosaminyl deacetylase
MDKAKQSIVAFGAHPDDIEIGMGGTVAKLARNGYDVHLVIATLPNFTKIDIKEQRRQEAIVSAKITFGRKFVGLLDGIINKYQPEAVFTQWVGDSHQDHHILTRAVIAASRDVSNLFMYETTIPGGITENAFRSQLYVDITEALDIKANALECFESQKIRGGHLWINAVLGRCSYRGYQMNTKYAEAFEVVKTVRW